MPEYPVKEVKVNISGDTSGLVNSVGKADKAVKGFASHTASVFKGVALERIAEKIGSSLLEAAKKVVNFDKELLQLKQDTGLSGSEMAALRDKMYDISIATGNTTEEMLGLTKGAYASSKNIKFVSDNLSFLGKAYDAVGGSAEDFGEFAGKLNRELGLSGKELKAFFAQNWSFGRAFGEKNLREILPSGEALIEAAKITYGDKLTAKNMSNILAMAMVGGNPEAIPTLIRNLFNKSKADNILSKYGIRLVDKNGTKRDVVEVIKDIAKLAQDPRFKGKEGELFAEILGLKMSANLQKIAMNLKDIVASGGDVSEAINKMDKEAEENSRSISKSFAKLDGIVGKALGPSIDKLTEYLSNLDPTKVDSLVDSFTSLGAIVAKVAGNVLNIITSLDEGFDITGRWAAIINENEKKAAELQAQAEFTSQKAKAAKGDITAFSKTAPAGETAVPIGTPSTNWMNQTMAGTPEGAQGVATNMFTGHEGQMPINIDASPLKYNVNIDQTAGLDVIVSLKDYKTNIKTGTNAVSDATRAR